MNYFISASQDYWVWPPGPADSDGSGYRVTGQTSCSHLSQEHGNIDEQKLRCKICLYLRSV